MRSSSKYKGRRFEDRACDYLVNSGYAVLSRNFRVGRFFEADIIARDGSEIVGVEVKGLSGSADDFEREEYLKAVVSPRKLGKIRAAACSYRQTFGLRASRLRIDVIFISDNGLFHYKDVDA